MDANGPNRYSTFDWNALLAKLGGDETFARNLLGVALRSNVSMPAELRASCLADDYVNLAQLSHKVKGTAGDLVAEGLRTRAREAETAARESSPVAIPLNLQLAEELERFLEELHKAVGPGGC